MKRPILLTLDEDLIETMNKNHIKKSEFINEILTEKLKKDLK